MIGGTVHTKRMAQSPKPPQSQQNTATPLPGGNDKKMRTPPERDPLGTPRDVAEYIGVSMGQLANLRWRMFPVFVEFEVAVPHLSPAGW